MAGRSAETLSALMSHVLVAFTRDYEGEVDASEFPSLVVLSNVLRVLDNDGIDYKALPTLSRMSLRAVRISTTYLERDGLLGMEQNEKRGPKMVVLTPAGRQARDTGRARFELTEQRWNARFGEPQIEDVWLSMAALISQAFTAFTIDYDEDVESVFGGLQGAVTFFRHVGDKGISLDEASQLGDVTGTGRSNLERHRLVVVAPRSGDDRQRLVKLTARGKRVRDRYPDRVMEIEQRWRSRFGAGAIDDLRKGLEEVDAQLADDLPDFPDTNSWLRRSRRRRQRVQAE